VSTEGREEEEFRLDFRRWMLIFGMMLAMILEILDTSIVNVALPDMMGNLGATVDEISWVVTGYIIANVVIIPMTSWLTHLFGRRRYFVSSILLFTAASALCGMATSLPALVGFRILQGLGGGALLATVQAVMVELFPASKQGIGQAIFGVGAMLGPSLGPTLGGWLTSDYSWRWIFYINLPLGALAAALCAGFLPEVPHRIQHLARKIDYSGIALLVVGIAALQTVLERGHRLDWFESRAIVWLSVTAGLALATFVVRELRAEEPVVDLRVLHNRALAVGCVYGMVVGLGLYGSIFLFPVYTQSLLRWDAWDSGLAILPASLATAVVMAIAGRLVWHTGAPALFSLGLAVFLPSIWAMSRWTTESGWNDLFWPQVGRGIAMGLLFVPLSTATLRALAPRDVLPGAGLFNLARMLGGSLGVAVLSTLLEQRGAVHRAHLSESVSLLEPATQMRLQDLSGGLELHGVDSAVALDGARQLVDAVLAAQSAILAFRDCYLVIGALFAVLVPFVFLMRSPRVAQG
jgi:DHA2 family multidrug resistance protein